MVLLFALLAVTLRGNGEAGASVTLQTAAAGVELSQFHTWTVNLPASTAVKALHFDATMPAHGHGLADQPQLRQIGPGVFEVSGVRFHMAGAWQLRVRYQDGRGSHTVMFPFEVRYASSQLRSLWLGSRGPLRRDPTNRFADQSEAAALGKLLFFDKRLSGDGTVSCASCHRPESAFADNLRFSRPGVTRNTPGLLGVSEAPWLFWDGRRDSLWSQALLPIESPVEMGGTRAGVAKLMRDEYRAHYQSITGIAPEGIEEESLFAAAGKFLAAYQRTLQPAPSRFDRYVAEFEAGQDSKVLTPAEVAGLRIFLSPESRCMQCHNGPLFTNQGFHNIGTGRLDGDQPDFGRAMGLQALPYDRFNCRSRHSDQRTACASLDFARADGHDGLLTGAFKVPSLRNAARTAPYMHDGSLPDLAAVIQHYRKPPKGTELRPLEIDDTQAAQLAAFLRTLTSN